MYKIGEFSKLTNLSVRTLRYYDEIGILKPNYVDTFSNYRYYTEDNIAEVEYINMLRSVGYSLEEIYMYKEGLTSEAIDQKIESLEEKIVELESAVDRLNAFKSELGKCNVKKKTLYKVA